MQPDWEDGLRWKRANGGSVINLGQFSQELLCQAAGIFPVKVKFRQPLGVAPPTN
jgi:hypothetical protein